MPITKVETLAIWLHGAAKSLGQAELLRSIVHLAAVDAAEMYALPSDDALAEDDEEPLGVRKVIGQFAAKLDECRRWDRQDAETH